MMEVKQNTAVDLNDLLTSSKNSGTDEVDDAVMTDLTDGTHDLVNCDLIKTNDLGNGDVAMTSLIDEVDVATDINTTVNSELEDALLAEDDVLPKISSAKIVEPSTASNEDDILADKVETSNSTTSSSNVRDPGDDLDTLLSKINDIVEDCRDNESETIEQQEINKIIETKTENNLNESVIFVKETPAVADEKEQVKEIEAESSTINDESVLNQSEIDEFQLDQDISIDAKEADKKETVNEEISEKLNEDKELAKETEAVDSETNTKEEKKVVALENNINNIEENQNENLNKTEKKEESKDELVQDNEITTSNSNEVTNNEATDKSASSPKVCESKEENLKEIETNEDKDQGVVTEEPKHEEAKQDIQNKASKPSENAENEDSDDEIVFYVDKPPEIEKSNETETKSKEVESNSTASTNNEDNSSATQKDTETPAKKTDEEDDDVVLLLDDEDEDVGQDKKAENKTDLETKQPEVATQETEAVKISGASCTSKESKDIDVDNSDNARDDFVSENVNDKEKLPEKPAAAVAETPEETNSNCSSSSNLLQEAATAKTGSDEATPEEPENEEEEDEGDVELIESDLKETETSEKLEDTELAPPAKRIRLSVDSEPSAKAEEANMESKDIDASTEENGKNLESKAAAEEDKTNDTAVSTLKRSHDVIEVEADEETTALNANNNEGINKKARIDDLKNVSETEEKDEKLASDLKQEIDDKKDIKAIPSYKPIPLYPAPKFEALKSEPSISLEFLKKFRKSFDNMTKQDLEELVLQKVVEAIIHKSEFSEMRELIEKQEKLITAHRSKISELSKQFRDLEMVHNRVVKDIEQRNSQFIMPVKITRAVGLQVYIPNKKAMTETGTTSSGGPNVPSSPQRPISSQASSSASSSTSLTPPQRQFITSQTETQQPQQQQQQRLGTTVVPSAQVGAGGNVRRGCVQKITPIRPVPGANQSTSPASAAVAAAAYRNTPNHTAVGQQPRILNKNVGTPVNPTSIQRSRFVGSNQDPGQRVVVQQQQQISRTTNMAVNSQRVTPTTAQPKPPTSVAAALQRRSEPLPPAATATSSSSIVDNYINTLTHLTGGNTAVSITPAKPKEKAVIDLTDEDETPGQTPATQIPNTQVQRRSLPAQNSTNSQLQYGRAAPPLARIPPNANQMVNNNKRQMSTIQAQKNNTFTGISTPPGTSITRINIPQNATNVQRVKYSHPAPLPATPPQAFNPSWKLPPPRPTIRISNLDNGIVISWTMEESMDRHAECVSYQIYAYQETSGPPMVDSWRHVGDVKAMLLPMAVTLTQFQEGQRYYFAVRAVDCHQRYGPFSLPKTWS